MNREETLKILAVLKGAYPAFYRGMGREDAESIAALWQEMFAADDYQIVAAAVKALISSDAKGYPPHIGAVKAHIWQLTSPPEMSDAEAWALAEKAVRRTDWNHPEVQFNKLPPDVQAAVGDPHTLVEWGKVSEDVLASVISSHFRKTFMARQKTQHENAMLPPEVKSLADTLAGRLALDGKEN